MMNMLCKVFKWRALLVLLWRLSHVTSLITQIPLPTDIRNCFEDQRNPTASVGEVFFNRCVHRVLWQRQTSPKTATLGDDAKQWISGLVDMANIDATSVDAFNDLLGKSNGGPSDVAGREKRQTANGRRQPSRRQPRVRKEYRLLTDEERRLFHRALNMLRADRSVSPNKFAALGRLHLLSVDRSHFGPNFFPFHRLLLVVMENALREKIPSVTIPYWDTTLDDGLLDPRSSILWTTEFLGDANGYVTDGPFANWETPTGPLLRFFGTEGTMMNWTYIHNAFRQDHLENITTPYALPDNNLEEHHNQVHLWVGGQMAPPRLAAYDPVFYLLHSYVDLLWEIFRGLQKRRGVDPTTDYPMDKSKIPAGQHYNDSSGFGALLNRHGLSNVFTDNVYKYERPPTCTRQIPDCGSDYLRCDTSGPEPKCISASIFDPKPTFLANGLPMNGGSGVRHARSVRGQAIQERFKSAVDHAAVVKCQADNVNSQYVNTFLINGKADETLWSYIPVQVYLKNNDKTGNKTVPVYDICTKQNMTDISRRVFVESNGLNYDGAFKHITHFRKDLSMDASLAFVGVKRPRAAADTEVIISAYDNCGRVCQPYCVDASGSSRQCAGAVKISREVPFMYGDDVASTTRAAFISIVLLFNLRAHAYISSSLGQVPV
ncbi:TYR3-like protein [Mya arenaria]|uniref:TYR3-like protein n=1 Tax=Mya arenaria TaxID=6604 RepID=A0ABY7GC10_MYAAR|nr:TYR3-like protein [Mya arenaria]